MATYYIDSNAAGANDGTSFTDAFTSITGPTLVQGDVLLVASDHSESLGSTDITGSGIGDWITCWSVNSTTEAYETGAEIISSGNFGLGFLRFYGFTIECNDIDDANARHPIYLEDCTITCDSIGGSASGQVTLKNCDVEATDTVTWGTAPHIEMYGGSVSSSTLSTGDSLFQGESNQESTKIMVGVDLTSFPAAAALYDQSLPVGLGRRQICRIVNCEIVATQTILDTYDADYNLSHFEMIGCEDGTLIDPSVQYLYDQYEGTCESSTTVYRDNGASDGYTPYSYELTARADHTIARSNGVRTGLYGITTWVEPGNTNIRVHIAHNGVGQGTAGALHNGECWPEYVGPGEAVTPVATGAYILGSRARHGETTTDLPTDSVESWTGAGVGTLQYADIPIAPTMAGQATVWVNFAPGAASDTTIHVCPKLEVT